MAAANKIHKITDLGQSNAHAEKIPRKAVKMAALGSAVNGSKAAATAADPAFKGTATAAKAAKKAATAKKARTLLTTLGILL